MLRRRLLARGTAARALLLVRTNGWTGAGRRSGCPHPLSEPTGMPFASGSTKKVVVLLTDKPAGLGARSTTRSRIVKAEVGPLARTLRSHGATHVTSGTKLPFVVASVSSAQEQALKQNAAVKAVFPDAVIPRRRPRRSLRAAPATLRRTVHAHHQLARRRHRPAGSARPTPAQPENDPEALSVINAGGATALGIDGAGVTVGYIAGSIDTTDRRFPAELAARLVGSPTARRS